MKNNFNENASAANLRQSTDTSSAIEKSRNEAVDVFFAADKGYLPYLSVAVVSLSEKASSDRLYRIHVLSENLTPSDVIGIKKRVKSNVKISVIDISDKLFHIKEELALRLRDYYSSAIYYRLFIPEMFGNLDKAVYLDSDIVLNDDVAKLFDYDIADNLLGAVADESVLAVPVFCEYVVKHVGLSSPEKYFNSGVLVMNLTKLREEKIRDKFIELLCKYNFKTVAPDQDYLNFLCQDKVAYIESGWNKHAIAENVIEKEKLHLMHYNMFNKPWHYENVQNEELFWEFAEMTEYKDSLLSGKLAYTEEEKKRDSASAVALLDSAKEITDSTEEISFASILQKESNAKEIKKAMINKKKTVKPTEKTKAKSAPKNSFGRAKAGSLK